MTELFRTLDNFATIGLDDLFRQAQTTLYSNYPPSNLIKFTEDGSTKFLIEVAAAGFSRSELTVQKDGDYVRIKGTKQDQANGAKYLHRGIAKRDFHLDYLVAKFVEVESVKFVDGILSVHLRYDIPEQEKARIFEIL